MKRSSLLSLSIVGIATSILTACQQPPPPMGLAPIYQDNKYVQSNNFHRTIPDSMIQMPLDYCLKTALTNNPDFLSTHAAISAAWARYYQSLAPYSPQVSTNYSISGNSLQNHGGTGGKTHSDVYNSSPGVSAQWLLFDGLMREMNMLSAQSLAKETEYLNQDARRILIRSVGVAYNNILLAVEQIRIIEEDRVFNQRLLDEAKIKLDAGTATLSDVYNFQVRLMDTENMLIAARAQVLNNRYILAQLMGLTTVEIPERILFPSIMDANKFTYILSDIQIYLNAALTNRPDLKAYRTALVATEYNLYSAYGAFSPKVYANGGYGFSEQGGTSIVRNTKGNYGISAEWVLFDGFSRWNKVREMQSLIEQRHYDVAKAWLSVVAEVRQSHLNYNTFETQLEVYRQKLELVKKTRDLVVEEYNAGKTTIVRVNEVQKDVVQAESNVASSSMQVLNARIQLEAATGMSQ